MHFKNAIFIHGGLNMRLKVTTILLATILSCSLSSTCSSKKESTLPPHSAGIAVLKEASEGFSQVAEKAIPAVVSIKVHFNANNNLDANFNDFFYHFFGQSPQQIAPPTGSGTGFFISDDGYILTNNHLVNDASSIKVSMQDGREFEAQIIGSDPSTEVALIKVEGKNFPYLTLADSDKVRVGQWAIAIGNPFEFEASVTVGVVSATGRNQFGSSTWENYIQTDAAINPGNSGGPLLDLNSQVVGINTAILTKTGGYMGLSFAIPSNLAKHVADQLRDHGFIKRGYLGVRAQTLTPDLAKAFNLQSSDGVVIIETAPKSPAEKAGLQEQDVIIKINDKPLTRQTNLTHEISLMSPGSKVMLTISRDGKIKQIQTTIGEHPLDNNGSNPINTQNALGVEIENLTPEVARQLGYTEKEGVVITKVKPNSQLAMASVRTGTLILAVNRHKVTCVEDFYEALGDSAKNKHVLLLIRYGKITRYVTVNLK